MKYAWIAKHRAQWPITLACEVLGVSGPGLLEDVFRQERSFESLGGFEAPGECLVGAATK